MPEASEPAELTQFGAYKIVRKLARGGMAEVYLARSGDRMVVLKKILPRYASSARYVQLFLDEAKLAASLEHRHIVDTFDMGTVDGQHYFAMEYVHGQDVRAILRRSERAGRPVPLALTVKIARDVAEALHHAHERRDADGTLLGIVHRDVSPSNILVSYEGAIKLADFGVAKASSSSVRTRTGTLKGKVGYMSPEQARGIALDRRSDVFSLGVVLWELVSIRRLFKSDNDLATIQAIINFAPPPLTNVREECPPELAQIIERALQKDRETRYQTAEQLQMAVEILERVRSFGNADTVIREYLAELFDVEIAAWRAAQSQGGTVTDFVVATTELTTPISTSGIEELSFAEDPAPDDEPFDDEEDEPDTLMPQPPLAGSLDVARPTDDGDKTIAGPPPVMVEAFDTGATQIDEPPFPSEVQALQGYIPTIPTPTTIDLGTVVHASPPPPQPIPALAAPAMPPPPSHGWSLWESINQAPRRTWIVIGAGVAAVLVVIVVIATLAGDGRDGPAPAEPATELPDQPSPTTATPAPEMPAATKAPAITPATKQAPPPKRAPAPIKKLGAPAVPQKHPTK